MNCTFYCMKEQNLPLHRSQLHQYNSNPKKYLGRKMTFKLHFANFVKLHLNSCQSQRIHVLLVHHKL